MLDAPAECAALPSGNQPTPTVRRIIVRGSTRLLFVAGICIPIVTCTSRADDGQAARDGPASCEHTVSMQAPTEVAVDAATAGCLHEQGQLTKYETTSLECADGRMLFWNEAGWGYDSGTWHPGGFNETELLPLEERSKCQP